MAFNSALFTTFNNGITLLPTLINVSTINSNTINIAPAGINNFSFSPFLNLSTIGQYIDTSINNVSTDNISTDNISTINVSYDIISPTISPTYDIEVENASSGNNPIYIPYTTNQVGYRYKIYDSESRTINLSTTAQIIHTINVLSGVWIAEFSAIADISENTIVCMSLSETSNIDNVRSMTNNAFDTSIREYNLNLTTVITAVKNTPFNIIGINKIAGTPKIKNIIIYITRIA
jgi:hypothetical protein